jgi:hypothetical protein
VQALVLAPVAVQRQFVAECSNGHLARKFLRVFSASIF